MNTKSIITAVTLALFTGQAFSAVFVDPKLAVKLRSNGSKEVIRSVIHFNDKRDLDAIVAHTPKGMRTGVYLAQELKAMTLAQTAPLRNYFGARKGKGVDEVRVLWGTNSLMVKANAKVLTQVLAMNAGGIEALTLDEELPVGEMNDNGTGFIPAKRMKGHRKSTVPNSEREGGETFPPTAANEEQQEESEDYDVSWAATRLAAPTVWATGNEGQKTLVAVIDSGAAIEHPDLAPNVWINKGEIPGNGIDDDNNGYVDDVHGYNFEGKDGDVKDTHGHGSQTAGIVAGMGTGGTLTGIAPKTKVMILKSCCGTGGSAFESNTWEAIQYAMANGAQVISMSLSAKPSTSPSYAKWRRLGEVELKGGIIHVNSAGNLGSHNAPRNIGAPATNPPAWHHASVAKGGLTSMITIGATDKDDKLRSYSSTGPVTWEKVEEYKDFSYAKGDDAGLVKPEVCGPSEMPSLSKDGKNYTKSFGGTSSATPSIAGVVALMVTAKPDLTPAQATEALVMSAIPVGDGYNNKCGGGRVDAVAAVNFVLTNFQHSLH